MPVVASKKKINRIVSFYKNFVDLNTHEKAQENTLEKEKIVNNYNENVKKQTTLKIHKKTKRKILRKSKEI